MFLLNICSKLLRSSPLSRNVPGKCYSIEQNTKISNDFVLYQYTNPSHFRALNFFIVTQTIFWPYMSSFMFTLRDIPVADDTSQLQWYQKFNLGEKKTKIALTIGSFIFGTGVIALSVIHSYKIVRKIILKPGGHQIDLITNGVFGRTHRITVPLTKCSCENNPNSTKGHIQLRIFGRKLKFSIDTEGQFPNRDLFLRTVGMKRTVAK